ncbi:hypothetical protein QR680_008901 [Steinernema hermaphroditum]|uniref:Uncharacterized protein n=1 Tax=Steinernema hermaphroditum TaxID=289476 RepID=A0AA39M8Y4_9BILA|nr:hypothetical protein QR680_008901 [Steinernema hermaphroditum]
MAASFQLFYLPSVSLATLFLSSCTLVVYVKRSKKSQLLGMFLAHIVTYIFFASINLVTSSLSLLHFYSLLPCNPFLPLTVTSVEELTQQLVSVSGTSLALDRVFIMSTPVSYAKMSISSKVAALSLAVNATLSAILTVTLLRFPPVSENSTSTYDVIKYLTLFFNFTLLFEVLLNIIFCVQFGRYAKKQSATCKQTIQINHITLFLCASQTFFCVVPNALAIYNEHVEDSQLEWIDNVNQYNHVYFTANVLLSLLFTLHKIRQKPKGTQVVQSVTASHLGSVMAGAVIYKSRYEPYCLFTSCSLIIVSSVLSLFFYVSRPRKSHPLGMLFVLLSTHIVYGILNAIVTVLVFVQARTRFIRSPFLFIMWNITSPQISELVASISGAFLALDRVLIMSLTLRYTLWRIGSKLSILCALMNTVFVVSMIISVVLVGSCPVCFQIVVAFNPLGVLDVVFCVQFWKYAKRQQNSSGSGQANHIALFQVVSHTILCSLPQLLMLVRVMAPGRKTKWVAYVQPYHPLLYSISVLLTSLFTLYKLRPKDVITRVQSMVKTRSSRTS